MRNIDSAVIRSAVEQIFCEACLCPPDEVNEALKNALKTERSPQGRETLSQLIENNRLSKEKNIPSCQDTGMAVVFAEIGQDVHITGEYFEDAINAGVRDAYGKNCYRKSVLGAIDRKNTKDNTPAIIHTRIVPGDKIKLIAAPKGFGSENMSAIKMLKPSDGVEGIINFVIETAKNAGGSPCPPVVLGVGIGGTFEHAALMAKRELLRPIGKPSDDAVLADIERRIKDGINALGMGPMGLGGDTYCLSVHAAEHPTHLAGLPVAVNCCCHAVRHAEIVL